MKVILQLTLKLFFLRKHNSNNTAFSSSRPGEMRVYLSALLVRAPGRELTLKTDACKWTRGLGQFVMFCGHTWSCAHPQKRGNKEAISKRRERIISGEVFIWGKERTGHLSCRLPHSWGSGNFRLISERLKLQGSLSLLLWEANYSILSLWPLFKDGNPIQHLFLSNALKILFIFTQLHFMPYKLEKAVYSKFNCWRGNATYAHNVIVWKVPYSYWGMKVKGTNHDQLELMWKVL